MTMHGTFLKSIGKQRLLQVLCPLMNCQYKGTEISARQLIFPVCFCNWEQEGFHNVVSHI